MDWKKVDINKIHAGLLTLILAVSNLKCNT